MRSYRKWVLSLGLAALTPGAALAGPFSWGSGSASQSTASNQELAERVASELRAAQLAGFDIEVEVRDGVCKLTGKIGDAQQKQRATQAASRARGIRRVENELIVERTTIQQASAQQPAISAPAVQNAAYTSRPAAQPTPPTAASRAQNQQVAEQIAAAIKQSGVRGHKLDVKFSNGVAVLQGNVAQPQHVAQITQAVSRVPGVQQVDNRLTAPGMPNRPAPNQNQAVAEQIAAVLGQAGMSANDIEVRYNNGVATLRGAVSSPRQAMAAEQITSRVPGVQSVNNELQLAAPRQPNTPIQQVSYMQNGGPAPGMPAGPMMAGPVPGGAMMGPQTAAMGHGGPGGPSHMAYDMPHLPQHSWPSYAAYPNYAAVQYPTEYSASAWPYIGPFYPYPQVPLGWRQVQLEWDDGYWNLNFRPRTDKWFWFLHPDNW